MESTQKFYKATHPAQRLHSVKLIYFILLNFQSNASERTKEEEKPLPSSTQIYLQGRAEPLTQARPCSAPQMDLHLPERNFILPVVRLPPACL